MSHIYKDFSYTKYITHSEARTAVASKIKLYAAENRTVCLFKLAAQMSQSNCLREG